MSWQQARAALDSHLAELPMIEWEKVEFQGYDFPAQTERYWKVDLIPSGVDPVFSGADHEMGIYQVSVWVPTGTGIADALDEVQRIVDHFKKQVLSGVACGVPAPAPLVTEADWLHFPVSIPFSVL